MTAPTVPLDTTEEVTLEREHLKAPGVNTCACGATPWAEKIGEWPAQYLIVCACGQMARGPSYGSDDQKYRHRAAMRDAVKRWNTGGRVQPDDL